GDTTAADGADPAAAENTLAAYRALRRAGYRIVATAPHRGTIDLEDFQVEEAPTALVFGNELDGLTETALEHADAYLRIPMRGFVDSFNISVSAALCMHFLTHRLRHSRVEWRLSEGEKQELRLAWLRRSIRRVEALEAQYYASA
ncbi:MAG: TrmH family RNA methyltransferase, partial [Spirochaetaceae bacterium]